MSDYETRTEREIKRISESDPSRASRLREQLEQSQREANQTRNDTFDSIDKLRAGGGGGTIGGYSGGGGTAAQPISTVAALRFLVVWAAIIWAFMHVPALQSGLWSGAMGFSLVIAGLMITAYKSTKVLVFGCLIPFTLLGIGVCYMLSRHFEMMPPVYRGGAPGAAAKHRTVKQKHTMHQSAHQG